MRVVNMMKRICWLALLIGIWVTLFSCSNHHAEETVLKQAENGIVSVVTLHHKGDNVIKQSLRTEVHYEDIGLASKEEAEKYVATDTGFFKLSFSQYKDVKGVEYSVVFNDDYLVEEMILDFKKLDFEKVMSLRGIWIAEQAPENKNVSLGRTIKMLEDAGYQIIKSNRQRAVIFGLSVYL